MSKSIQGGYLVQVYNESYLRNKNNHLDIIISNIMERSRIDWTDVVADK